MKIVNKIMLIIIILIIIPNPGNNYNNLCIRSTAASKPVNVAVLVSDITDPYIAKIKQDFENIQKSNQNKVQFTFFDTKKIKLHKMKF